MGRSFRLNTLCVDFIIAGALVATAEEPVPVFSGGPVWRLSSADGRTTRLHIPVDRNGIPGLAVMEEIDAPSPAPLARAGSASLGDAVIANVDGGESWEVILPDQRRTRLSAVSLTRQGPRVVWSHDLGARVRERLVNVDTRDVGDARADERDAEEQRDDPPLAANGLYHVCLFGKRRKAAAGAP